MRVFKENSPHPFRNRKQKHVVTKSRRPVGNSQSDAFARHHSAAANEEQGGTGGEPDETIQPGARNGCISHLRFKLMANPRDFAAQICLPFAGVAPRWAAQSA